MIKERRNWKMIDPVEYFRNNCPSIKGRAQLRREDSSLFYKLIRDGKLRDALPEMLRRDYGLINPVDIFHEKYSHIKSRAQLSREDPGLYCKLNRMGKLDEILPETQRRNYKKNDPVKLFYDRYAHITSRVQLVRENIGLYLKLLRNGYLDELLPNTNEKDRDWSKIDPVKFFGQNYHYITSREQLKKEDSGLYSKLSEIGKLDELLPSRDSLKAKTLEKVIERYTA